MVMGLGLIEKTIVLCSLTPEWELNTHCRLGFTALHSTYKIQRIQFQKIQRPQARVYSIQRQ
jgi:hypothetical protein